MNRLSRNSSLVLATVARNLRFLRDTWNASITEDSLAVSSNVLRLLLVDKKYGEAWRIAGFKGEPSIKAVDLDLHAAASDPDIVYAQAGGGKSGLGMVAGVVMWNRALTDDEIKERFEHMKGQLDQTPGERLFRLTEFLESPCILHAGQTISRRIVIKYVANKLGGVHVGGKDRPKEAAQFAALEDLMTTIKLADRRSPYFELLSIGQAVRNSYDAGLLIDKAEELGVTS